jgi:hypothetical protein
MDHGGADCWCNPIVIRPCPECEDGTLAGRLCWRCDGAGFSECDEDDEDAMVCHDVTDDEDFDEEGAIVIELEEGEQN